MIRMSSMIFILVTKEQLLNGNQVCIMPHFLFFLFMTSLSICRGRNIFIYYYFCYLLLLNKLFTLSDIKQQPFYYSNKFHGSKIWTWQWLYCGLQHLGPLQSSGWLGLSWILEKRIIWRLLHLHIWHPGWDDSKSGLKLAKSVWIWPLSVAWASSQHWNIKVVWVLTLQQKAPRMIIPIRRYMVF